jgi:hypothetical protein
MQNRKRFRGGFTIRGFLLFTIFGTLLGFYLNSIFNGDNSIRILCLLNQEKEKLIKKKRELQEINKNLQKEYFELIKMNGY